jgi:predicted PurR-regulated permease PerM
MPIHGKKMAAPQSLATIANVLLAAFIFSALYFGRALLVPLALAALLTFMLTPLVTRLQRWLGRVGAVLVVVTMIVFATGAVGWVVTRQVVDLAGQLPNYKENVRAKLHSIRMPSEGPFSRLSRTLEELKKDLPGAEHPSDATGAENPEEKATPVEVVSGTDKRIEFVQMYVAPVLGPLGTAALVLLLLIFMLLEREDLRNRFIRLIGQGRISETTIAMDEAASRVSRYLLMQLVINVTYGIPVAIGLYFIGVPNAMLWGALATVLRFIPYVGPWIAAVFPVLLSLAVAPNWMAPALTITLFVVLELFSNNVMEPWLYGSSTGVTPIAVIVTALVWTLLWGPVGLVLATPLTVCLVVMGRHIPRLSFLSVILSDEEPLTPAEDCYHRLHSVGEQDEMQLVDSYLKSNPPSALFDSMLIPVIAAAETDHRLGLLETEQLDFIEQGVSGILEDLELRGDSAASGKEPADEVDFHIACVPAKAYRDQLAGEMLAHLLHQDGYPADNAPATMVASELAGWVHDARADVVCISVVPPTTINHARYLCLKLRKSSPALKIIVGLWGSPEKSKETVTALHDAGADDLVTTMAEAMERVAVLAGHTMEKTSSD